MSENHADVSGSKNPRARAIMLIHPDGSEERFDYIKLAIKKYKIGNIGSVLNGRIKTTKGFAARYI